MAGPGFIATPGGVQVRVSGLLDTLPWSVGMKAVRSGLVAAGDLTALSTAAASWASGTMAAQLSADASITQASARDISVHLGSEAIAPVVAVGALGISAPSAMCAKVDLVPAGGGFRHPGALFWPALDKSLVTGDTIAGGYVSNITAAVAALRTALNGVLGGSVYVASMVSFWSARIPRPLGIPFPIATVVTRPKVATQVRRLRSVR